MTFTPSSLPLQGKIALVTGSSRGIGRGIAIELARNGADVIVNYRVNAEAANQTLSEISAIGRKAIALQANIGDAEDVAALFRKIRKQFGGIDILVLNAATGRRSKTSQLPSKVFNLVMSTNLYGPWLCVKEAVPLMRKRNGGRIVVITTTAAFRVLNDYSSLAVSKAAIDSLVKYLAVELAPENIIVNAVAPGAVLTDGLRYWMSQEEIDRWIARTPMKRTVRPNEVGNLVAFLCSDEAAMICGQIIAIDGGYFIPAVQSE